MSAGPSNFRKGDVKRAVQALRAAGLSVGRVELHGSTVTIIPSGADVAAVSNSNPWDKAIDDLKA